MNKRVAYPILLKKNRLNLSAIFETRMKRIKLLIHEPSINKVIGRELNLLLDEKANLVDTINEVDKIIQGKGSFPCLPDYKSLLHMVYNPVENKFYKQVAITAYNQAGQMLNVRDHPKKELTEGAMVTLIPAGGCISEWEEPISYDEFVKALSQCKPRVTSI